MPPLHPQAFSCGFGSLIHYCFHDGTTVVATHIPFAAPMVKGLYWLINVLNCCHRTCASFTHYSILFGLCGCKGTNTNSMSEKPSSLVTKSVPSTVLLVSTCYTCICALKCVYSWAPYPDFLVFLASTMFISCFALVLTTLLSPNCSLSSISAGTPKVSSSPFSTPRVCFLGHSSTVAWSSLYCSGAQTSHYSIVTASARVLCGYTPIVLLLISRF